MKRGDSISNRINEKVQEDFRDLEIEYQLMAYIIRENPAFCGLINKNWLSDEMLQDVYDVILEAKAVLPQASLKRDMKTKGLMEDEELLDTCLDEIYEVDTSPFDEKAAKHLMSQVLDLYESRRLLEGIGEILSKMKTFNLKRSKKKLKELSRPTTLLDDENVGYYIKDYPQRIEILDQKEKRSEKTEDGDVGIPTGIYKFDRACGGIMPGEFGVIGGMTGVGKTLAIGCFGITAWEAGYNVMIVSGEMEKAPLEFRIDANLSGIPAMKFRNAELTKKDMQHWDATIKKYEAKQYGNFFYIATFHKSFSVENIENEIIKIQEESGKKLDWLGIDYLNIMDPVGGTGGGSKEWAAQSDVVWDVKGLTSDYGLVTWTAGQVRDEAYNKDLYDPSDLKYARAIGETAPVVIALIRTDEDLLANRMRLQVLKMRNAILPKRPIMLSPNMSIMRLNQDIKRGVKTLAGMGAEELKVKKRTKHVPKKRSIER